MTLLTRSSLSETTPWLTAHSISSRSGSPTSDLNGPYLNTMDEIERSGSVTMRANAYRWHRGRAAALIGRGAPVGYSVIHTGRQ